MLRYTSKIQQAIEQGIKQGIEQGKAEGKAEIYRAWYADWEKRKQAVTEKGIPFDEPPPHKPENTADKQ